VLDTPLEQPRAGTSLERPADRRSVWGTQSRFAVHLGLLSSAAAALGTLQLLHVRVALHTVVGLVFVGLVVLHLAQRRRTIARMASQIVRARTFVERRIRLAVSDLLLLIITVNMLVSGIVDWSRGAPSRVPLPMPFSRWHLDSGLVLVIYLAVHFWRRRKRLRRSTIR
jgi:alpha/beta superfamily hydrolase